MAWILKNAVEREDESSKRRRKEWEMEKDGIIVRKTYELTNDSLTLFNEIFLENDFKAYPWEWEWEWERQNKRQTMVNVGKYKQSLGINYRSKTDIRCKAK